MLKLKEIWDFLNTPIVFDLSVSSESESESPQTSRLPLPSDTKQQVQSLLLDLNFYHNFAKSLDQEKFKSPEFLQLIRIKYWLSKGYKGYKELEHPCEALYSIVLNKDIFFQLYEIEARHGSSSQNSFYYSVERILKEFSPIEELTESIKLSAEASANNTRTQEGRKAIYQYRDLILELTETPASLNVLLAFKEYNQQDLSTVRQVIQIVEKLHFSQSLNLNYFEGVAQANFSILNKCARIIGLDLSKNTPSNHAKILQYILLKQRNSNAFSIFQDLLRTLKDWYRKYQELERILTNFPETYYDYKLSEAPGIKLFENYRASLTDHRTGLCYIEF